MKTHNASKGFDVSPGIAYFTAAFTSLVSFLPSLPNLGSRYLGSSVCDMNLQFRHFIEFGVRTLRTGEAPLWNPHIFCGTPFLPSTHATLFYPLNAPFLFLLPQPLSINLCILLHVCLFACFTVHYVRVRGLSNVASMFAGMAASLCALMPARIFAGHFTMVCTAAWIPLVFCFQEKLFASDKRYILPLAAVTALMFLAGHHQYTYYACLLLTANILIYAVTRAPQKRRQWIIMQFKWHFISFAIAFAYAAIEILPLLDVLKHSARGHASWARFFSMPPENLVSMIVPGIFGTQGPGIHHWYNFRYPWDGSGWYWGRWYWWEVCFYMGIPALVLCITAIAQQVRRRRISHVFILFMLSSLLAVSGYIPFISTGVNYIPGWSLFRGHAKILGFAMIFGALLAGEGFDLIRQDLHSKPYRFALGLFLATSIACLLAVFMIDANFWSNFLMDKARQLEQMVKLPMDNPGMKERLIELTTQTGHKAMGLASFWCILSFAVLYLGKKLKTVTWHICFFLVVLLDLFTFAIPITNTSFSLRDFFYTPPAQTQLFQSMAGKYRVNISPSSPNMGMSIKSETMGGHDINVTRFYNTFISAYLGESEAKTHLSFGIDPYHNSELLDAANLGYEGQYFKSRGKGGISLRWLKRSNALPRAYVVGSAKWVPDNEEMIRKALLGRNNFQKEALLAGSKQNNPSTPFKAVKAQVRYDGLHRVHLKAPRTGWLVLTDAFYPRWQAAVAGKPAKIFRANGAFRAVKVKAGDHVLFSYKNPAFTTGAILSMISVALTITGVIHKRLHDVRALR